MLIDNFDSEEESSLSMNCNVVFVLPHEYNQMTEAEENKEADEVEMARHRIICYYIMNNGVVEEHNAFFE